MTTDIETKQIRKRVLLGFARIAILILFAVILFRIVVPYFFNMHTDLGVICAVASGLFGLFALIWFAFDSTTSIRRRRRS